MNFDLIGALQTDDAQTREKAEAAKAVALVKAEETYIAILTDPTRTGDKDKAAMVAAMKLLGKTPDQAASDAQSLEAAASSAERSKDERPARQALAERKAELLEFHTVTKLEMNRKIADMLREKNAAVDEAEQRLNRALHSLDHAGRMGRDNPHLLKYMPPEAQPGA